MQILHPTVVPVIKRVFILVVAIIAMIVAGVLYIPSLGWSWEIWKKVYNLGFWDEW